MGALKLYGKSEIEGTKRVARALRITYAYALLLAAEIKVPRMGRAYQWRRRDVALARRVVVADHDARDAGRADDEDE